MVENPTLCIIGLGYVGLPLAVAFGRIMPTIGFDLNAERVAQLRKGVDATRETSPEELRAADQLSFTTDAEAILAAHAYIVAVPTPIDRQNRPDLGPLLKASELVGRVLSRNDVVIFESTVYPGATEEDCVPVLEKASGLVFNRDFFVGYSPERINPGDHEHRLATIVKITAGSTPEAADWIDALYRRIITAGTHKASSIRVAEAAKVIENTQRDVNIALINELAMIFDRLGLNTQEVLEAAGTKWNFLPFRPGLVGGHCIGVDPYYLTHKAQEIGYHPEMILAGRRINDNMGLFIASQTVKLMIRKRILVTEARILVMGLTFKENCPDLRNTRVISIINEFEGFGARVDVHDPWVDADEARREYGVELIENLPPASFDAIVLAVGHDQFKNMGAAAIRALGKPDSVIYDLKYVLPADAVDGRL